MFELFDKSGRRPRELQLKALKWIQETAAYPRVAIQAGTGVGKSGIGVSCLVEFGGIYCVPTNMLMDQLTRDYPHINSLKGMDHYTCSRLPDNPEFNCSDAYDIFGDMCDDSCEYYRSVTKMLNGEPTFVNPFSYLFAKRRKGFKEPPLIVVDEAHTLIKSFMLMSGTSLLKKKYGQPNNFDTETTLMWIENIQESIVTEIKTLDKDNTIKKLKLERQLESLRECSTYLRNEPHLYVIYDDDKYTHIKPIKPPKSLVDRFFHTTKTVLMSATLTEFDVDELLQNSQFQFLQLGTPIPKENRTLIFRPAKTKMNYQTPPEAIAAWIKGVMRKYPNRNTIVHLTYNDVQRLLPFFPNCIAIEKDTKNQCIEEFKKNGGLLLAAACSEGIDLPGDECRLNLIPRLIKPNLSSPDVKKRRALNDGQEWYTMQIMTDLIQQIGRSTRGTDDYSISVVGDPNFKWQWSSVKSKLPSSFNESIRWYQ